MRMRRRDLARWSGLALIGLTLAAGLGGTALSVIDGGLGLRALALAPLAFLLAGLAVRSGVSVGIALAMPAALMVETGQHWVATANLHATLLVAALPSALAAIATRWLRRRAGLLDPLPPEVAAIGLAAAATAVPVALVTVAGVALADRAHAATIFILACVLGTGMLALALTALSAPPPEGAASPRMGRGDWWMFIAIGAVSGYIAAYLPFGGGEIVLVYLLFRGQSGPLLVDAPLMAGIIPLVATLPTVLARQQLDFSLLLAILPAAFAGSVAASWWKDNANPLIGTSVLSFGVVASSLTLIILALR